MGGHIWPGPQTGFRGVRFLQRSLAPGPSQEERQHREAHLVTVTAKAPPKGPPGLLTAGAPPLGLP